MQCVAHEEYKGYIPPDGAQYRLPLGTVRSAHEQTSTLAFAELSVLQ